MFISIIVGRLILGAYFLYNAYSHFRGLKGMTSYAESKKVPFPKFSVILTGIMLLVGGLAILSGFFAVIGMAVLVLFLVPTTLMMHNFWKETDPMNKMNQKIAFFKNMALVGGASYYHRNDVKMSGFTKKEIALFMKMKSPAKVQDFLNSLPSNKEKGGETCRSPLATLRSGEAHCMEGALLGAYILSLHGFVPYVIHLRARDPDQDHAFAPFKVGKFWGAISKTNHAVLRYREPIYRDPRELVMSFFHEYFLNSTGEKTLRSYTLPIDLRRFGKEWITRDGDVWDIDEKITRTKHYNILSLAQIKNLRKAEKIERKAGEITEW